MNEMIIGTSLASPQEKETEIKVYIENKMSEDLLYKFIINCDGGWETIRDFHEDDFAYWTPKRDGKYMVMVQSKKRDGKKPIEFTSRIDFIIGSIEEKLIKDIIMSDNEIKLGDKIEIDIIPNKLPIMCKYWISEDCKWNLIRDYSIDTSLRFTPSREGEIEMLIECKEEDSEHQFDDFKNVTFKVLPMEQIRINNIQCLTEDLIVGNELTFEVDAHFDENRVVLYKFIRIDEYGNMRVVQDFSSKRLVSFTEIIPGEYKLLCLLKDMYSHEGFDDRGIIHYSVDKYKPIKILNFTSDLSSPQLEKTPIEFKAICSGGDNLLYKFIVDGNHHSTSNFTTNNSYKWIPEKSGIYRVEVLVKDSTYSDDYEEKAFMDFVIDEDYTQNVYIKEIKLNKDKQVLINDSVQVKVEATGARSLLYEFCVKKEGKKVEFIEYNAKDSFKFTPTKVGKHEIEIRVKHPKSTRDYDVHSVIYIDCKEYIPAKIDYILTEKKYMYIIGDEIVLEVITENTSSTLAKYKVEINGREVETTEFGIDKKFKLIPKCAGVYTVKIYCKNVFSTKEFDCKKEIVLDVLQGAPVTNCKITLDKEVIKCNEDVNFYVKCDGGKDKLYEFYLMEKGEWKLIQKYSKKNYYTFMPFYKGFYKILALCKSSYSKSSYEDYSIYEVQCKE
ncbi:triple tyrosine motif-containing protein [Clostridium sp. UBA1056]|uniref:triple tyrosine motif-containing protein n=1 Tax=unclassified Clostridium TaxID=2614128 RepID=UPI003216F7FE